MIYALSLGLDAASRSRTPFALTPAGVAPGVAYNVGMDEGKTSVAEPALIDDAQAEQCLLGALLARMVRRDEAALAEFYDATAARVYALARRIAREERAAEEVVSDVYLQVWQQAARYDATRGRVLSWLLTICRSRALDCLRRRDKAELHPTPDTMRPDLYCDDETPLDLLLAFERSSRVHTALAALGEKERQLLALAFFEGLSHQEIATRTGMPLGSVKTVLRRALQTLRSQLDGVALASEKST